MTLLNPDDVRALLPQADVDDTTLDVAMRLVAGWLRTASGQTALADPLPDDDPLFAPALELVLLVVDNPTSLTSKSAGPTSQYWPLAARREEILDQVRLMSLLQPKGEFPCVEKWPDPAYGFTPWWNSGIDGRPTT